MQIEFVDRHLDVGGKWLPFMMVNGFHRCLLLLSIMMIGSLLLLSILEDGSFGLTINFRQEPDFGYTFDLLPLLREIVGINLIFLNIYI